MEEEMLWLRSAWIMWLDDHNRQADDDHERWTWKDDCWSSPSGKPQPPTLLNLRKVEGTDHWRQVTVCGTNRPRKQWQLILQKQHMLLVVDYKFKSVFYSRFEKKKNWTSVCPKDKLFSHFGCSKVVRKIWSRQLSCQSKQPAQGYFI